jgi:hypothetical protein
MGTTKNNSKAQEIDTRSREEIITNMCYTYRHDYGLNKDPSDPSWCAGMTPQERQGLWRTMAQIFDNNINPYMEFKK